LAQLSFGNITYVLHFWLNVLPQCINSILQIVPIMFMLQNYCILPCCCGSKNDPVCASLQCH